MNLLNMAKRKDKNLELVAEHVITNSIASNLLKPGIYSRLLFNDKIVFSRRKINNQFYRGLDLDASENVYLKLKSPLLFYPFREFHEFTGWQVMALDSELAGKEFSVELIDREDGQVVASSPVVMEKKLCPVKFPYPLQRAEVQADSYDLKISAKTCCRGRVFLAVHKALNRREVIKLCKGNGIEIGPGLNPQIMPANDTTVIYLEQSNPEDWDNLYNTGVKRIDRGLWKNYRLGEAKDIPFDDQALDFIFSSHVFEHLANPIGHLAYWRTKLKKGGVVVGVVPDVAGSKDYVHSPCPLESMIEEYKDGCMEPQLSHYERWAKYRASNELPEKYFKMGRSIHVHYYTAENMKHLLDYAVENLGYQSFSIIHTPNHKDFYFTLIA